MAELEHISSEDFKDKVIQASKPVLVDFSAVWCGPCKLLEPVLIQLANEWKDQLGVLKLDVDQNPDCANTYKVLSIPTLILFKGGKAVERITGYQPKDRLVKVLTPHL